MVNVKNSQNVMAMIAIKEQSLLLIEMKVKKYHLSSYVYDHNISDQKYYETLFSLYGQR